MNKVVATVAIVEDDDLVRAAMGSLIRSLGFEIVAFASAELFLAGPHDEFACIVSDVQMPGVSGLELQELLANRGIRIPMILMTAYPSDAARSRAVGNGAYRFLEKPCDPDLLADCLTELLEQPGD